MNTQLRQTLTPSSDEASAQVPVLITKRLGDNGPALGISSKDGKSVYFPATIATAFNMASGETWQSDLVTNTVEPERTPWFCRFVIARVEGGTQDEIGDLLADGGVWTAEQLAKVMQMSVFSAATALDALYLRGECSKFLRFDAPSSKPANVWYTKFPERADVDEFEPNEEGEA